MSNPSSNPPGSFVISLDFELFWGVRDLQTKAGYGANILGARRAIPAMLALFEKFNLHATWATVGLLFFGNRTDLLVGLPSQQPAYADANLSNYVALPELGPDEAADPYYYGHSLLEQIRRVPGQEVATHTFSHYYCLEPGQNADDFRADLAAAVAVAQRQGYHLQSLVFPRNQYNTSYLAICRELGITCYRGNEAAWMYQKQSEAAQTRWQRGARLLDAYLNVSGSNTYSLTQLAQQQPFNIPASRFLRPWSGRLQLLEGLRLRRILNGMEHAARHKEVFHLWWHPHNFGANLTQNMLVLQRIAEHFWYLQARYGMVSQSMSEVAAYLQLLASA
ncbi:polysaccharide deacetylase family protein [Hymenobacter psoromatis]|uniref:polysaccharide deacetylase family protein n=1 Tax=Hymenobacter psoromatis TaxID=1484116 RepID=UPI001CBCCD20|nr:polysaccharide deacetylase family protein [Hymenobacter psoromatis]